MNTEDALRDIWPGVKHPCRHHIETFGDFYLPISRRTFWKYAFFPLLVNAALLVHIVGRDPGWMGLRSVYERLECFGLPVGRESVLVQGMQQGFAQDEAPQQRLVLTSPGTPRLEPTDTPGWSAYTVAEGASSHIYVFEVHASGAVLTFFPRVSGPDSSVEVAALPDGLADAPGGKAVPLARLSGKPGEWTPISARWSIPLLCLGTDRPLLFRVTLTGPWAQLWVRDGAAFF